MEFNVGETVVITKSQRKGHITGKVKSSKGIIYEVRTKVAIIICPDNMLSKKN